MEKVSVLLASSYRGSGENMHKLLKNEKWIQVVGTSSSVTDAIEMTEKLAPEVVVVDRELADSNAHIEQRLLDIDPGIKIIFLKNSDSVGHVKPEPMLYERASMIESTE